MRWTDDETPKLRELMNCCRPDLSDLTEEEARTLVAALEQDPVLRREWQAIQSWDVAIGRASRRCAGS